jgi:anaerobic magnesium-protoporphyrin IX monomethyl ester cyclase
MGDLGVFVRPAGVHDRWQDHGMGVLRTILQQHGVENDMISLRSMRSWGDLQKGLKGYDMLLMNVRSYTFPLAYKATQLFKKVNPKGLVVTGGMHATVAPDEMEAIKEFDRICQGPGEGIIVDLVKDPLAFPRLVQGVGAKSLADWPMMDRTLWPNPHLRDYPWPLEPECGWGPGPVATILTSRVCPWQCVFCNESSYIPNMVRKPV